MSLLEKHLRLLVLPLLVLVAISCGKDHVTNPGPTEPTIVFSSYSLMPDLYAVYPNGAGLQRLTNDSTLEMDARWSPDGSKIVFADRIHLYEDSTNITVMNADGSHEVRLTRDFRDEIPSWSPDGSQIGYQNSDINAGHNGYWVMNADGSNQHLVLSPDSLNGVSGISWTRQNTLLGSDPHGLVRFNADGSGRTRVFSSNNFISFAAPRSSRDGSKIVFAWAGPTPANIDSTQIWIVNADGTNLMQLTTDPGAHYSPVWSANGRRIAYGNGGQIWTMNADGSSKSPLPISNPPQASDELGDWK